jgi:outer membrane protein OmpA-like peptidoglycan-associated protein
MSRGTPNEGFALSMVDLMTSLVVIFILLLVVFLRQTSVQAITEAKQTETNREQVIRRLRQELKAINDKIEIKPDDRDPLTLFVIVPPELMQFEENNANLREIGKKFLQSFAPTMTGVLCAHDLRNKVDALIIEGHTNSRGEENLNIPLSARRATEVTLYSLGLLREKNATECFLELASSNGRGPRDPIPGPDGFEDLEKSKRVEFKVRVRSIEQRRLQEIQEQLHAEPAANS